MKQIHGAILLFVLAAGVLAAAVPFASADEVTKVGVYDSRIVALAHARSGEFLTGINEMKARHKAAKARGDEETAARLEKEGPALQDKLHKQVFGNAPIPEIMKKIEKQLPDIAREAGVDLIVCKWDIAYQAESAKYEDVTMLMVNLFKPSEETLKIAREMRDQAPVPLEELEAHEH